MPDFQGNYLVGEVIPLWYHSYNSLGASATPSSIGSCKVYRESDVTGTSVGISTHSITWNGIVGMNLCVVTSSASSAYYSHGGKFHVVASGTSIDSQFVNVPVGDFTLQREYQAGLIHRGILAAAGSASVLSIDATAGSSVSSFHDGNSIFLSHMTGAGQARIGISYAGTGKSLTLDRPLTTAGASGTSYEMYAGSLPSQDSEIGTVVWSSYATRTLTQTSDATIGKVSLVSSVLTVNSVTTVQSCLTTLSTTTALALSSTGNAAVATSLLSYDLGNSRLVQEALYPLRNKVDASSSVGTVYKTDDSTSAWTFSNATAGFPLGSIDPAS